VSKYAKFIVAVIVACLIAGLTALVSALQDNAISPQEWATIALAFVGALGVYFVPNATPVDLDERLDEVTDP